MRAKIEKSEEFLTIAEAALWAGRSQAWVRTWRSSGPLEAVEIAGRQGVTLDSLRSLVRQRPRSRRRPCLRLVVNNTPNR